MSDRDREVLKNIIEQKRLEDPVGLLRAQQEGKLADYLSNDLKKNGISSSVVGYYMPINRPRPRRNPSGEIEEQIEKAVTVGSDLLDDVIFSQLYKKKESTVEAMIKKIIADSDSVRMLRDRLKYPKVVFAFSGMFLFLLSLWKLSAGNTISGVLCLVLSSDLGRMSSNCYLKTYCANAGSLLFGSIKRTGNTILAWMQTTVGLQEKEDDPLHTLQDQIVWEAILEQTLTKHAIFRLKEMSSKKNR